jgi:phosphopantetheinyl transferase (holo-ACP synthase)
MNPRFSVSLSCLSTGNATDKAPSPAALHDEGRRVLFQLDKRVPHAAIQFELSGRPYFADRHADFSISHSRAMVAVSHLSTSGASRALHTGCDIQFVYANRFHKTIASRFFGEQEQRYIAAAADSAEQATRFCKVWAMKECFLKARGSLDTSMFNLKDIPCFAFDGLLPTSGVAHGMAYFLYECADTVACRYILAVGREVDGAAGMPIAPPRLCWVSDTPLRVSSLFADCGVT